MVAFIKQNILILALILVLGLYLGIKALDKNGWDGWGCCSAQTLMSSEYWAKDGFVKNYFLFIPWPYSKLIGYFDESEFRNRPIETLNGELARGRLYYTHYPPLYLAPYALIAKIGFTSRFIFRILALAISLSGLIFFYWFIKLISDKTTAIIASVYYSFSFTFLNYADSLANQPFTIFFTFLILVLSILADRNFKNRRIYARYNLAIWLAYLTLALSSYDTTFFVFAWLVLYDAIILKKFIWRKWLFWALAPILAFTLQIFQNVWYLGFTDAMRDIYISYIGRATGSLRGFVLGLITPFVSMTGIKTLYFFKKTFIALGGAVLIVGILWKLRTKLNTNSDFFKIISILAMAAIAQPFFINITGWWPYQGVLTAPFWGLLIGFSSVFIINTIKKQELTIYKMFYFWILAVAVLTLWSAQLFSTFVYIKDWPNNRPDQKVIEFSKEIKKFYPDEEKLAFRIYPKNPIWKSQFPTFSFEYYLGMLKVDFANTSDLLVDFWWFRNISKYPFYSFIIAENKNDVEKIRNEIKKTLPNNVSEIKNVQDQYLFIVDPK